MLIKVTSVAYNIITKYIKKCEKQSKQLSTAANCKKVAWHEDNVQAVGEGGRL